MVMGEYSAYSSLQADSKLKLAAWPTILQPPALTDFRSEDQSELLHIASHTR